MKKFACQNRHRIIKRGKGATITELLVATVLIGISMAALGEIMGLMTILAGRVNNRASALDSARMAVSRISADIRATRAFGDSYAGLTIDRFQFPSGTNPIYGPSGIPVSNAPYKLSSHTLILQCPVFYNGPASDPVSSKYNIFPMAFNSGDTTSPPISVPAPAESKENLDTVIYDVVQDGATGEFLLEMRRYPGAYISSLPTGMQPSSYKNLINDPAQRLASGITGPKSKTGSLFPVTFKYFSKDTTGKTIQIDPDQFESNPLLVSSITGVGINLELNKPDSANVSNTLQKQQLGIHTEAFTRSNRTFMHKL